MAYFMLKKNERHSPLTHCYTT